MNSYSILDLFDPMSLVHMVTYQGRCDADYWERQHIDAMVEVCDYIKDTYPNMYDKVTALHDRFLTKTPDY